MRSVVKEHAVDFIDDGYVPVAFAEAFTYDRYAEEFCAEDGCLEFFGCAIDDVLFVYVCFISIAFSWEAIGGRSQGEHGEEGLLFFDFGEC